MNVRLLAHGVLVVAAGGCFLPAFSADESDGGGGSSSTTESGPSPASTTSSTSSDVGGGDASTGGGAGGHGGGCADVSSDPENCGACGVSCLGGDCASGVCQPLLLVDDPSRHFGHLAVGGGRIWWQGVEEVAWIERSARSLQPPTVIPVAYADMIAADGDGAYVTTLQDSGAVVHVPMDGGVPVELVHQEKPVGIAVEDGILYWTEYLGTPAPVWTRPTGSGDPEPLQMDLVWGMQVAVDEGDVYATFQGGDAANGGVVRMRTGGSPQPVASDQRKPSAISLSASHVYWLAEDGAVWRRRRDLVGEPELVAEPVPGASVFNGEMAIDGAHVYWTAPSGACDVCGAVLRASLGGGEPAVFADVSEAIHGLAVDGDAVYWTTAAPVGLYRKAKQP